MFYADQHMHSSVSFDSHTARVDMAEAADRVQAGQAPKKILQDRL